MYACRGCDADKVSAAQDGQVSGCHGSHEPQAQATTTFGDRHDVKIFRELFGHCTSERAFAEFAVGGLLVP